MKELVIDGKKYQKATELAKHLGYTSDYVGQLCRAGKVDATQIGRTWYVVPDTLHEHKQTRYQSNVAKSRAAVQSYKAAQSNATHHTTSRSQGTRHLRVAHYEDDSADLIPTPRPKTTSEEQSVRHEGSEVRKEKQISITSSEKKPRRFEPGDKPKVHFKGSLSVTAADEVSGVKAETAPAATPAPVPAKATTPQVKQPTRRHVTVTQPSAEADQVSVTNNRHKRRKGTHRLRNGLLTLILLGFTAAAVFSLQNTYEYDGDSIQQRTTIDTSEIREYINKNIVILFKR